MWRRVATTRPCSRAQLLQAEVRSLVWFPSEEEIERKNQVRESRKTEQMKKRLGPCGRQNALWCSYTHPATTLAQPHARATLARASVCCFKAQPPGTAADAKKERGPTGTLPTAAATLVQKYVHRPLTGGYSHVKKLGAQTRTHKRSQDNINACVCCPDFSLASTFARPVFFNMNTSQLAQLSDITDYSVCSISSAATSNSLLIDKGPRE